MKYKLITMFKFTLITLLLTIFLSLSISAQIGKGVYSFDNAFSMAFTDDVNARNGSIQESTIFSNLSLSGFVDSRLQIGTELYFVFSKQKFNTSFDGLAYHSYGINPFARLYINPKNKARVYFHFAASLTNTAHKKNLNFGSKFQLGIEYLIKPLLAIDASLGIYSKEYSRINRTFFPDIAYAVGDDNARDNIKFIIKMKSFVDFNNSKKDESVHYPSYLHKGKQEMGGTAGIEISNEEGYDLNIATHFRPKYGFFLSKNFLIGTALGIGTFYQESIFAQTLLLSFRPYAKYFVPLISQVSITPQISYSGTSSKEYDRGDESFNFNHHLSAGAGLHFFIDEYTAIEATLTYKIGDTSGDRAPRRSESAYKAHDKDTFFELKINYYLN